MLNKNAAGEILLPHLACPILLTLIENIKNCIKRIIFCIAGRNTGRFRLLRCVRRLLLRLLRGERLYPLAGRELRRRALLALRGEDLIVYAEFIEQLPPPG